MDPTPLQSAESFANIVTGAVTAGVLLIGGLLALWRFFLQGQFRNSWSVELDECRLRRTTAGWSYILTLTVANGSAAGQTIKGWWRRILFVDEVGEAYDPNSHLNVSCETATAHFGSINQAEDYPLSPGEKYTDKMIRWSDGPIQEVSYVEYTLCFKQWRWKLFPGIGDQDGSLHWTPIPWREQGHISHKLIAPVNRSDLEAANAMPALDPQPSN